jgi:autoinducer 2-degrading protein
MFVTLVHVHVKPEHLAEFIETTRANHLASVREPGNLRFDAWRDAVASWMAEPRVGVRYDGLLPAIE